MLAKNFQASVTEDTDPVDGTLFYLDPERRCEFFHEEHTPGPRGLAFAVILRALEDGVNERWLRLLAWFYEVPIPEHFLQKKPERRLRMDSYGGIRSAPRSKLVLTWFDITPIQERDLTMVA